MGTKGLQLKAIPWRITYYARPLTEQTSGRAMDAQPKQDQRLVPSHLTDAEHVITSVPGNASRHAASGFPSRASAEDRWRPPSG
jgi:hypothetical protein